MRIRKCASLLLGAAVPVPTPPQFELPPSPRFDVPPPAHESHSGLASMAFPSSSPEPCCLENFDPWDLFDKLDLSDPQEEERFVDAYSVPVARPAGWLLPTSMSVGSNNEHEEDMVNAVNDEDDMVNVVKDEEEKVNMVNDEEEHNMAVDTIINESNVEPSLSKEVGRKTARKKDSKPKMKKGKEKAEESHDSGEEVYTCKKNDGKNWFCQRRVSQPDTLCSYHSDPKLPGSLKPQRKKIAAFSNAVDEGFYYYTGFGPSHSAKRHRGSSSRTVPEPALTEEKEEAQEKEEDRLPEQHIDVIPGQAQDDDVDHNDIAGIAGSDEEISCDDGVKRTSLVKKRKRKRVNTRSINLLMSNVM